MSFNGINSIVWIRAAVTRVVSNGHVNIQVNVLTKVCLTTWVCRVCAFKVFCQCMLRSNVDAIANGQQHALCHIWQSAYVSDFTCKHAYGSMYLPRCKLHMP